MRLAAVDIGTNTVRVLLRDEGGHLERVEFVTGLGHGVDATGKLSAAGMERVLSALAMVHSLIGEAAAVRVAATSASRDAANRAELFAEVAGVLGQEPELLDGAEEARLSFAGATGEDTDELSTVIDLGGGSTEIISGRYAPDFIRSYDVGSVRVTDRHLVERPASGEARRRAVDDVQETLDEVPDETGFLIGVGGTFQTLGLLIGGSRHGVILERDVLDRWVERLASLTIEETAAIPEMVPARAPVLLGGTLVAAALLARLDASRIAVSERDLLDGMMAELVLAQSSPT